jgi:hypothetical protein
VIALPVVNFRPLLERNFTVSSVIIFCAFGLIVLVPLMKRSVAEKGEHVGAE